MTEAGRGLGSRGDAAVEAESTLAGERGSASLETPSESNISLLL
jgi:hypothetical protein